MPINRSTFRSTQRAPRSCQACASRKIKCDKSIPCSTCARRGEAESCAREMVVVRGTVTRAKDPSNSLSYQQLLEENRALRDAVAETHQKALDLPKPSHLVRPGKPQHLLENPDVLEKMLLEVADSSYEPQSKLTWDQIVLPSRECSEALVAYDKSWNSWVHYALEYPKFEHEHEEFLSSMESGSKLLDIDAAWLAVYFSVLSAALLMADEDEAFKLHLPGDHHELLRNWYEAALFCLNQSNCLRTRNIRTVQAIAVLGICFYNFGDAGLNAHLWSCAVRIAQALGLDGSRSDTSSLPLNIESQRRLWWTLVICEWLAVPYHAPQMSETDFTVALPSMDPIHESGNNNVQPVQYHIVMARMSTVYHRFREALRRGDQPVAEIVHLADQELAEVIDTLPEHLQPDSGSNPDIDRLDAEHPWIKWQRFDISLVLLHHRLRIHRAVHREWLESPGQHQGSRAICLRTARDIVWISKNWDQPAAMRRQWALSLHLFVAAIFLLRESRADSSSDRDEFNEDVNMAIAYLDEVKSRNVIADRAASILRNVLENDDM